ncbi:MAG: hypothetical protein FJ138_09605, partial [Deltaproteobacteria bacterium]|nr:hypothetical protein [Deltaproteobacteria bacterium]
AGPADAGAPDARPGDAAPPDAAGDLGAPDMAWTYDLGVTPEDYRAAPPPTDRLYAGYADRDLGYPVGAAVVGFGPRAGVVTPFARLYPGTDTQHTDLLASALVLRQGETALALVRLEMIGVWQGFVVEVQRALRAQGRGDLADGLILSATHTHASGGQVFKHPIGELAVGPFSPEMYTRYRRAVLDAVLSADAAAAPARLGYTTLQVGDIHSDRRCENGPVQDDTLGLLKVTDDAGALKALVVNYAMHGTVVGNGEHVLSSDAPGAVERGIAQRLPADAPVLFLQSWAGDMAPRAPAERIGAGSDARPEFAQLDAIGAAAAARVIPALDGIATHDDVPLAVKTIRFPASNDLINPDGSFDRFPFGGTFCLPTTPNCDAPQRLYTPENLNCLRVQEANKIDWAQITAAYIGAPGEDLSDPAGAREGLALVTLPGEPLTSVGVTLREAVKARAGVRDAWVLGYAQGYLAYLIHPDDFWLGGYEGAGALWGPGFGEFLIERGAQIAAHLLDSTRPLSFLPVPLPAVEPIPDAEYAVTPSATPPAWRAQPAADGGLWRARWLGGDPVVDLPVVSLERLADAPGAPGAWEPVRHPSGRSWSSRGPELQIALSVTPTYAERMVAPEREFEWRVELPARYAVTPSGGAQLTGVHRLVVRGAAHDGPYALTSEPFELLP